jgi:hypothetical protein
MKILTITFFACSFFGISQAAFADLQCSKRGSDYAVSVKGDKLILLIDGEAHSAYRARGSDAYVVRADRGQQYVIRIEERAGRMVASVRFFGWGAPTSPEIIPCRESN